MAPEKAHATSRGDGAAEAARLVRLAAAIVTGAAAAALGGSRAEAAGVRLAYDAPPECPGREAFVEAVRAQTKAANFSPDEGPSRELSVRIVPDEGQLRGRLQIEELDGATSVREVTAATCSDVVSALSLMAAMAIDADPEAPAAAPSATPKPGDAAPPASAAPPRSKPPATSSGREPAKPGAPTPKPARLSRQRPADPDVPRRSAPPASAPERMFQVGVHGGGFGAVAPEIAWGAVAFIDSSAPPETGAATSIRFGLALAQSPAVIVAEGAAMFRWYAARLSGCPFALAAGPLTIRPCGGLDAGILQGSGFDVARPLKETRAWIAATAAGRIQIHLGEGLFIEADAGFTLPFTRDKFIFVRPERDIHQVPPVSGFATAGLAVLVP